MALFTWLHTVYKNDMKCLNAKMILSTLVRSRVEPDTHLIGYWISGWFLLPDIVVTKFLKNKIVMSFIKKKVKEYFFKNYNTIRVGLYYSSVLSYVRRRTYVNLYMHEVLLFYCCSTNNSRNDTFVCLLKDNFVAKKNSIAEYPTQL